MQNWGCPRAEVGLAGVPRIVRFLLTVNCLGHTSDRMAVLYLTMFLREINSNYT